MRSPKGQLKEAQKIAAREAFEAIVTALEKLPQDRRIPVLKAACILTGTEDLFD